MYMQRSLIGIAMSCFVIACAFSAPGSASVRGQKASPINLAAEAQQERFSCDSSAIGATFQYSIRVEGDRAVLNDPAVYPTIGRVCAGSPAEKGGLAVGDAVLELNGVDFRTREARNFLRAARGTVLRFRVRRAGAEHEIDVQTRGSATPIRSASVRP